MPDGIADLNGNVWEWCAGMRLMNGEIQIIPYANCMAADASMGASSTLWKAIAANGTLVEPGTAGTLKYNYVSGHIQLTSGDITPEDTWRGDTYQNMTLDSALTVPEIAKALLIYPDEPSGDYGGDGHYMNNSGERLPRCGGYWNNTSHAGVFSVGLDYPRSYSSTSFGFRSAYCEL